MRKIAFLGMLLGCWMNITTSILAVENIVFTGCTIDCGKLENEWMAKAVELDISDNLQLLNQFQTISFAQKEKALKFLPPSQNKDPHAVGKLLRASVVITAELIEEKNSIICLGKIYHVNTNKRPQTFTVNGRTMWLLDFSENITWQVIDLLNLRTLSKEDEDRLRFKMKNNKRLKNYLSAEQAYINEDYPKALEAFKALQKNEPDFITPYLRIPEIIFKILARKAKIPSPNDYLDDVYSILQTAKRIDYRNRKVYFLLGKLYHQENWVGRKNQQAVEYLTQATELFPYYTEAYRELAYLYAEKMKKYEKAISVYDKISAYDPKNPRIERDIENIYKLSQGMKFIEW